MNNWKYIKNDARQSEIVTCMESLRPAIYQIISGADADIASFDYYADTWVDHDIILLDDGWEFAVADTDQFKNAGHFMKWALDAISTYYYEEDQEDPEESETAKYKTIRELVDDIEPEELV